MDTSPKRKEGISSAAARITAAPAACGLPPGDSPDATGKQIRMVPEEGLEPSHTHVRQILSLLRLPFRHSGREQMERAKGIEPS